MTEPLIALKRSTVFDAKVNELLILPCSSINNTDNLLTSISLSDKPEIRQKNNIGHASCGFPCSQKEGFENVSLDLMNKVPLDTNNNNNNCKINQDEVSSNSTPPRLINPACARLIPYKPLYLPIASTTQGGMSSCGNKLSFSTSGLTVTSQDSTVQTAISSIGLNSGEHIWQFICPISCEGVEFGVVSVETGQEMFLSFNTTTPRQLIFKVNFDNLRFLVFLNGNLHEKKSTNLPVISKKESSFWYPAVRLKETGMTVIFNPFAVDPSYISSTNSFAVITNDTQSSGQVYTNSLEIENKVQQAIQRIEEAPDMIEIIDHKDKEKSDINLINEEIKRNKNSLNNSIEGVINKDNLILLRRRDGKLKLIRRTCSGRFNLDSCSAFENKPRNASDSVWLILSRVEWKKLFIGIDWSKLQSKQDGVQQQVDQKGEKDSTKNSPNHIVLFLNSFIENTLTQGDYLHMYIQFDVASAIIQILCSSLNQMFINSQNYHSTDNNISQLPSQEPADIFLFPSSSDHPFEHLIQLMTISFALLEQLFGMTLHSSTQASLINFIQPQLSRSYSSYSRLSSLISSCKNDSYSQIELAEIGVYNTSDMLQSLQHFASPNIPLQLQIPQGNCSLKPSLTKDLFLQLPNNRMLRGEMYFNIPLHVTINSIPYSQHSSGCKNPNQNKQQASDYWIISSQSSNNSHNYICSACFDGSVNVWNTEIQLFSVLISDFTALFVPPKQLKGLWSTNDLKANLKNVELGLFYSTGKNEDILKQSEIRNQPSNAAQSDATKANLTTWTCKHCTFINTDTQHKQLVCTMCLQNRDNNPNNSKNNQGNTSDNVDIPAYQDPVIDDQSRYLLSLKKQGRINEYKVQRGQGVMAVSKLSKLCPLIVGLCLTKYNQEQVEKQHGSNEQKEQNSKKTISLLRLRRFGFSPEYLSNFYKLTQTIPSSSNSSSQSSSTKPNLEQSPATFNEISLLSSQTGSSIISQRGLVSQLSGELLSESTMGCIEDTIFRTENSRISVECLEPMFMSNSRFSSDSKPHSEQLLNGNTRKQHSLVNQSWIATCERDIVLSEGVKIKDLLLELNNSNWSVSNPKHLNRQEIYSLFILTDECSILMYQIILDNVNPYNPDSLQVSVLNSISLSSMIFKEVADQDNNSEDTMSDQSTLLMLQQHQQSQALLVLLNSKSIINVLLHKEQLVQQKSRQASIIQSFTQPILSYCSNNQGGISFLLDASNHQESSQCLKSFEIITIPFIEQQSLKVSVKQQSEEQEDDSQLIDKSTKLHQEQISFDTHFLRQLKAYLEYSPLGSRVISNQKQNKACAISQSCSSLSCHRLLDSTTQLWARHAFNNTITLSFDDNTTNLLAGKNFNVFNHLTLHLEYSSNNQQPNISSGYASNKQQLTDTLSSCDLVSLSAVEYISAECLRLQDHSDFSELSNPSTKPIHLPLMLESAMLSPNQESFITNYSKPSFTFAHLHQSSMSITAVVVHSVTQSQSGAFPIGSGLIFIADNVSFFEMTEQFHKMNLAAYRAWQQNRILESEALKPWEPVGCFEFLDGKEVTRAEMDVIRSGKYVHLLPTGFRTQPVDYSGHFNSGILDIQYFGVEGASDQEGQQDIQNTINTIFATDHRDRIASCSSEQLQEILDNFEVSVRVSNGEIIKLKRSDMRIKSRLFENTDLIEGQKKSNISRIELDIRSKLFIQNFIQEITVTDRQTIKNQMGQNIIGIEIETKGTVASSMIVQQALKSQSNESLCQKILKTYQNWSEDRVFVLLGLIDEEDHLDDKLFGSIDWKQLISEFVYGFKKIQSHKARNYQNEEEDNLSILEKKPTKEVTNIQSINQKCHNQLNEQCEMMSLKQRNETNKPILTLINAANVKYSTSIKTIFTLLLGYLIKHSSSRDNNDSEQGHNKPLESLDYSSFHRLFILLKYSRNIMDKELFWHCLQILNSSLQAYQTAWNRYYSFLRCDHFITAFPFEKQLFLPILQAQDTKDKDIQKSNSSGICTISGKIVESIPCRILSDGEGMINRTYTIDLMKMVDVQKIELQFEKATKQCAARMKIQIYKATSDSSCENGYIKHLVFSQDYTTATVYQLSVLAHQKEALSKYFKTETQGVDKLGIDLKSFKTRYLFIQCTFSLLPYIATSTDIQQATRIHILPNIKGHQQNTNNNSNKTSDANNEQDRYVASNNSIAHFEELFELKVKDEIKISKIQQSPYSFGYVKYFLSNTGSYILDSSGYYEEKVLSKGESNKAAKISKKSENSFTHTNMKSTQISDSNKDIQERDNHLDFEGQLQFVSNNFLDMKSLNSTQQQTNKEKRKPKNKVIQPSLSRRAPQQPTPNHLTSGEIGGEDKIVSLKDQLIHQLVYSSPSMLNPMEEQARKSPLVSQKRSEGTTGTILLQGSLKNSQNFLVSQSQSSIFHPVEAEDEDNLEEYGLGEIASDQEIDEDQLLLQQQQLSMEDPYEDEGYQVDEDMVSDFTEEQFVQDQDEDYEEVGKSQELEYAQQQLKIFLEDYHLLKEQGQQQSNQSNIPDHYQCPFDTAAQMDELNRSVKQQCDIIYKLQLDIAKQTNANNNSSFLPSQNQNNLSYLSQVILSLCEFLRIDTLSVYSSQSVNNLSPQDQSQQQFLNDLILGLFETFVLNEAADIVLQVRQLLQDVLIPTALSAGVKAYSLAEQILRRHMLDQHLSQRTSPARVLSQINYLNLLTIDQGICLLASIVGPLFAKEHQNSPANDEKEGVSTWTLIVSLCVLIKNEYIKLAARNNLKTQLLTQVSIDNSETLRVVSLIFFYILASKTITTRVLEVSSVMQPLIELLIEVLPRVSMSELFEFQSKLFQQETQQNLLYLLSICVCLNDNQRPSQNKENNNQQNGTPNIWESLSQFLDFALLPQQIEGLKQPSNTNNRSSSNAYILIEQDINNQYKNQLAFIYLLQLQSVHVIHHYIQHSSNEKQSRDQTNTKHPKQNSTDNRLANLTNPYSQVWRMYIRNNNQVNLKPNKELKEYEYVSLGHLDLFIALLASSTKSITSFTQRQMQASPSKKLLELQIRRRKSSESSRKGSWASRKGSEDILQSLCRKKSNTFQEVSLPFKSDYSLLLTQSDYIESIQYEDSPLIMIQFVIDIVEQLLLNQSKDSKNGRGSYYPEDNIDEDEEHKDFVNEEQPQNIHQINQFDYIQEKSDSQINNSAELEHRWILAMAVISLLPGKAIQESNIFTRLATQYLESPMDIQERQLSTLISLTKNILHTCLRLKEFCEDLISLVFSIINSDQFSWEGHQLRLVVSWLEMLLSKQFPPEESFYFPKESHSINNKSDSYSLFENLLSQKPSTQQLGTSCMCQLSVQGVAILLRQTSSFLLTHVNIGGVYGSEMGDHQLQNKLIISELLLRIIMSAESSHHRLAFIQAIHSQNSQHLIETFTESLSQLINFAILNCGHSQEDKNGRNQGISPCSLLSQSVEDAVMTILRLSVESSPLIIGKLVNVLFRFSDDLHKELHRAIAGDTSPSKKKANNLTMSVAVSLAERESRVFTKLLECWIQDDIIAQVLLSHEIFIQLLSIARILQSPMNNTMNTNFKEKTNSLSYNNSNPLQALTWILQGQNQQQYGNSSSGLPWNSLQNIQSPDCSVNPTSNNGSGILQPISISCDLKQTQSNLPSLNNNNNKQINQFDTFCLIVSLFSVQSISGVQLQSSQDSLKKSMLPPLPSQQLFSQLSWTKNPSQQMMSEQGIFGNSEISENPKSSFLKYQIAHPSYLNSNSNSNAPPPIQNHSLQSFFSSQHANLQTQQSNQNTQQQLPQLPQLSPLQQVAQVLGPLISQGPLAKMDILSDLVSKYTNQKGSILSNQKSQQQPDNQPSPNPFTAYQGIGVSPLGIAENSSLCMSKIHSKNTLDPLIFGPTKSYQATIPQSNFNSNDPANLRPFQEVECANQVSLIPLPGMPVINQQPQDWSFNKKGGKSKLLQYFMTGQYHQELPLLFKLNKIIEIKKIRIGFNTISIDNSESILGVPSGVLVEGGTTKDNLLPLGMLVPLNEERYSQFGVRVFSKNYWRISNTTGSIKDSIESLCYPRVSFIQLRIMRPCVSVMEDISTLSSKSLSKIGISVNFLSILGFVVTPSVVEGNNKVNSQLNVATLSSFAYQQDNNMKQMLFRTRQQGVLKVLGRLCNGDFPKTIRQLSQSQKIVESLKSGFSTINEELLSSEESFSELLLKFSDENSAFGDWLFEEVLLNSSQSSRHKNNTQLQAFGSNNSSFSNSQSKLLLKIMKNQASGSSKVDSQHLKTVKLLTFIEQQMSMVAKINPDSHSSSWFTKISCIFPAIEALLIGMQIVPSSSIATTLTYLPISSSFVNNLLKILNQSKTLINGVKTPSWFNLLTRLLSNLLYLPSQFRSTEKSLRYFSLNKIWNHIKQSPASHSLAMVLVVFCKGSRDARQFFCQRIPELAELLVSDLRTLGNSKPNSLIQQTSKQEEENGFKQNALDFSQHHLRARGITRILAALGKDLASLSRTIQSQPLPLALFSLLKRSKTDADNTTLLRDFVDKELLSAFLELFIESFNSNSGAAILSEVIVADIKRLGEKRDRLFVEELLTPLLSAQKTIPVCFHVFEESTLKTILNPLEVLHNHTLKGRLSANTLDSLQTDWSDQFNTQMFSKQQKNSFTRILKQFSSETGLFKKLKDYSWTKQAVQTHDGEDSLTATLEKSVLNNPPYIVLIEGKNNGIKCVCGVFCTQPLAAGAHEFGYSTHKIANNEDCFMFYYSEDYQLHFKIEGNQLGSLEVAENHSFLSFKYREMDRITISLSATSTSFVDINLFDMKPLESGANIPHDIPNEFTFGRAEYWVLKPLGTSSQETFKVPFAIDSKALNSPSQYESIFGVSSLSSNMLFPSNYYQSESAYNFYRVPPVYHFPSGMTLKEVILQMNVHGMQIPRNVLEKLNLKINLKDEKNLINDLQDKTLLQIEQAGGIYANGIIDISISIDELFRISNKPEGFDQNHSFIQQATNLNSIPAIKDIPQINNPTPKTEITVTRNNQSSATNQILKCFIAQKGVEIILQSITESLASWEDQKLSNMWLAFIKETKLYGGMPRFFSEMMKNELLKQTLLFLLGQGTNSSSIRSKDTINQQQQQQQLTPGETEEEQQRKAFKEVYGIVAKVLQQGSPSDNLIKQIAVKLNILQQLFERISQISKEEPREYVEDVNVQIKTDNETRNNNNNNNNNNNKVSKSLQSKEIETEKVTGPITTAANDQTTSSLPKKKKGIGYGTDQTGWNSKWNTNEYVDSKRNRNELLLSVIQAVCSFLEGNWKVPKSLQRSVCCSTLIVLLENAFRSGSLLEMSNQNELILEYLHLVELMAGQDSLLVALLPLGEHYKPKQISSIYELLQSLSKTADIFVHCLQSEQQESSEEGLGGISTPKQQAGKIADKILVVMECLERSMDRDKKANKTGDSSQKDKLLKETESSSQSPQSLEIQKVLSLPLSQKYKILLSNLRFGYVSMQDPVTSEYSHHYKNAIYQSSSVAHNKLVRLAQEVADMSNALPVEDTNSVFARCDTKRVDVMKCLIMGTAGTPYAHGAFLYDVYFEDNYPNSSPKVNLSTTGPGQVRFNPNLYQCGKVCLSLLGTWKGQASENWDPNISTLLQVLLSLQSIIMTEDVYFNEPGFEGQSGTEEGEKKNEGYSNIIRYCNIKIAMIKQIKNPPTGFEEIIQRHFYLKKEAILAECEEWLQRSYQKNAAYSGLVNDHNPTWCGLFKQPGKYSTMLAEAIDELREVLQSIPPPSRIDAISQQMGNKRKLIRGHIKPSLQAQTGAVETKVSPSEAINEAQQQHPKPISQQTVKEETAEQEEEEEEKYEFDIRSNISDQKQSVQQMDIHSEEVKNRWSRYICALGIESVRKQSSCSVFLSGCTNLGLEIAKNLTLAGLARLTILFDPTTTKTRRNNSLLGENTDPIQELQQLNPYVKVDCLNLPLAPFSSEHFQDILKLRDYQIVILTDIISHEIAYAISEFCHANRIFFIHTNVIGPFARVFIDFNEKFIVNDSNGEPFKDSFISSIEIAENKNINKKSQTVVTTLQPHGLQDGDTVTFTQVKGMERIFVSNNSNNQPESSSSSSLSINDTFHIVLKVQSPCTFVLASLLDEFSPYLGSGIVKGVKIPQTISFSSLAHSQDMSTKFFDANLLYHDFDKSSHSIYLHIAFYGLSLFQQKNQRFPGAWDKTDMREFSELCQVLYQKFEFTNNNQMEKPNQQEFLNFIALFSYTCSGSFHPLCAFIGGVVAQEAIKAMTNKFMPIKQFFYSDCIEVVPWNNQPILTQGQPQVALQSAEQSLEQYADIAYSELQSENTKNTEKHNFYSNSLVDPSVLLQIVIGKDLKDKLKHLNLFMIGSGAIGCELLKNFAMLSLCTGESTSKLKRGLLTLTDPDHIETSNLNRQFLFRQEHISKPKSITAAAAAIKINSHLKNHIVAKLDKVCEASKDIFNDGFFQAQDIVANALDNVQARKYVDKRCLTAKVPLLESGTLGPKGHVQVIVPYQSESYGSQEDPAEEGGDIPHCTLKMFPEETLHCVEWARDKFSKQATLKPKQLRIAMQAANQKDKDDSDYECPLSISELQKALKKLERKPRDFQDCIVFAVRKFYKYFRNTIRQLMHTYPLNTRLKDGTEFWKLPKRAPIEISMLDPNNQTHRDFIASVATICAKVFSIKYPSDFRKEERKIEIIQIAEKIQIDKFQPSEGKSQEIHSEVQSEQKQKINGDLNGKVKEQQIKGNDQINSADDASDLDFDLIQSSTKNLLQKIKSLMVSNNLTIDSISPEEFEKDNDQNGHIDFISSLANCRAINYSLTPMDWLDVKLKAGKIVPALATTTAAIAALQTIELVKQVMGLPISLRKNAFLNLAVPAFQLTEPAPPPIFKITSNISVSIWDNWEVTFEDSQNNTIQQLFDYFAINKKLQIVTILLDSELLFAQSMSEAEKISIKAASLTEAFFLPEEDPSYIELDILFTELDSTQILINTPTVRIVFKKQQSVSKEDAEAKYKLK